MKEFKVVFAVDDPHLNPVKTQPSQIEVIRAENKDEAEKKILSRFVGAKIIESRQV